LAGTNDTVAAYAGIVDYRPFAESDPGLDVSALGGRGNFGTQRIYTSANPMPRADRAGTNESNRDNRLEGSGHDGFAEGQIRWLLPLLDGTHNRIGNLHDRGGTAPPPIRAGLIRGQAEIFTRDLSVADEGQTQSFATFGGRLNLSFDTRDNELNPTRGILLQTGVSADPGWADDGDSWWTLEGEASGFAPLPLGQSFLRRLVIGAGLWTIDTPSWDEAPDGTITHRPPPFDGAKLGGFDHLRAYSFNRFNDRAAWHFTLELRAMPDFDPEIRLPYLGSIGIDWWQVVLFTEIGRVAPEWNPETFIDDPRMDIGLGLRALVFGGLLRGDLAYGDEGVGLKFMVGHAF
jgi:outer membrane protein assembly factor BamA